MMKIFYSIVICFVCVTSAFPQDQLSADTLFINESYVKSFQKHENRPGINLFVLPDKEFYFISDSAHSLSKYNLNQELLWNHAFAADVDFAPAIADSMIILSTVNRELITLDEITGDQIQSIGIDDSISTDLKLFDYNGRKELMFPKMSGSKTALIFGAGEKIFCYDLETLQVYWGNSDKKGKIDNNLIAADNKLFFTTEEGFIYCVDSRNGLLNWRWKESAQSSFAGANLLINNKSIFAVDTSGTLFSIDIMLGRLNWKLNGISVWREINFSKDQKTILVQAKDKRILLVSSEKGVVMKAYKIKLEVSNSLSKIYDYEDFFIYASGNRINSLDKKNKESIIFHSPARIIPELYSISNSEILFSDSGGIIYKLKLSTK